MTHTSHSLHETGTIARTWLAAISANADSKKATIVGLSGHLGAGKTAFVKVVAHELGITEEITSPTFVIMKIYPITHSSWKKLVHIDAYRLEKSEELNAINFDSLASDPGNLILMEWPEQVNLKSMYPDSKTILFEIRDNVREIQIDVQ